VIRTTTEEGSRDAFCQKENEVDSCQRKRSSCDGDYQPTFPKDTGSDREESSIFLPDPVLIVPDTFVCFVGFDILV
jgi:hypothetical protein